MKSYYSEYRSFVEEEEKTNLVVGTAMIVMAATIVMMMMMIVIQVECDACVDATTTTRRILQSCAETLNRVFGLCLALRLTGFS